MIRVNNTQISLVKSLFNYQQQQLTFIRCLATHWNPKFRKLRAQKVKKIELPDFDKMRAESQATLEERRSKAIKEGLQPPISFEYKPFNLTTSNEVFDPFVPPEGDGKVSVMSKDGVSQKFLQLKAKGTIWRHLRIIKNKDEKFDYESFPEEAQQIFIDAHEALAKRESEKLIELVTESCYPKMWFNNKFKTLRWKWIESIEPPQIVHAVTREMLTKGNICAQVTVRMHSKQTLAVYDRFGRLAYGDESLPKNVLEYLIFEKFLNSPFAVWRLHDKIIPKWAEPKMPVIRTLVKEERYVLDESVEPKKSEFKKDDSHLDELEKSEKSSSGGPPTPPLATA